MLFSKKLEILKERTRTFEAPDGESVLYMFYYTAGILVYVFLIICLENAANSDEKFFEWEFLYDLVSFI